MQHSIALGVKMLIEEIFTEYIKLKKPFLTPHSLKCYISACNTHIKSYFCYSYDQIAIVLIHTDFSVTKTYVTVLPFYVKKINESLLDSLKSDMEKNNDELKKSIQLGERLIFAQKSLFPNNTLLEVGTK